MIHNPDLTPEESGPVRREWGAMLAHLAIGAATTAMAGAVTYVSLDSLDLPYERMDENAALLVMGVWIAGCIAFHQSFVTRRARQMVKERVYEMGVRSSASIRSGVDDETIRNGPPGSWRILRRSLSEWVTALRLIGTAALIFFFSDLATLVLFEEETAAFNRATMQAANSDYVEEIIEDLNDREALLRASVDTAVARLKQVREGGPSSSREAVLERIAKFEDERARKAAEAEEARALERCEIEGGSMPGCSGDAGCKTLCIRHRNRAEAAEREITSLDRRLDTLREQVADLPTETEARQVHEASLTSLDTMIATKRAALNAFIAGRSEALAAALDADPRSAQVSETSIFERMRALGELRAELPAFDAMVIALKIGLIVTDFASVLLTISLGPSARTVAHAYRREIEMHALDTELVLAADAASRAQWSSFMARTDAANVRDRMRKAHARMREASEPHQTEQSDARTAKDNQTSEKEKSYE